MKNFLRKDTYIILPPTPSVNSFQDNLQLFHIFRRAASNQPVRFAWNDLHKVKRSPEGADERFSKGIFMKKIFKKGYLYYTPVYPFCQ